MRSGGALLLLLIIIVSNGCAAAAPAERPRIGDEPVFVWPIDDPGRLLSEGDRVRLQDEIVTGLRDLARREEKARRRPLAIAAGPGPEVLDLTVRVERFEPEGSSLTAFILGFGAGRPAVEARLGLGSPERSLGEWTFEKRSSAYLGAPGGPKEAMIGDIARAAVAFVRRRR